MVIRSYVTFVRNPDLRVEGGHRLSIVYGYTP
jgi:hypothetical protein